MRYSPILLVHVFGGVLGLISGAAAMVFRKGSRRHILSGKIFVGSMLTMAVAAVFVAIERHQPNNIGGGILTFYLIGSAWLAARRGDGETSRFDWVALFIPLTIGVLGWINGLDAMRSPEGSKYGVPAGMHIFMGSVCLLAAVGDLRMLLQGCMLGRRRIARHLWRMCFGLFIASGSFFMGPQNRPLRLLSSVGLARHLPAALFHTALYLALTVLPLLLLVFWLLRIRFRNPAKSTAPVRAMSLE
jgi:uncharacterized membrane protein